MGKILVIGSFAMKDSHDSFSSRIPKDVDLIADYETALTVLRDDYQCTTIYPASGGSKLIGFGKGTVGSIPVEVEIAWSDSTAKTLLDWVVKHHDKNGEDFLMAPLNVLYALKMSHRFKRNSPHFYKTKADILAMRAIGAAIPESLGDWYNERERETYNYDHPKLNTTKKKFFSSDGIDYVYDHDSIHLAVKNFEYPAYDYFKPDTKEVYCSKDMFFKTSENIRLSAVYEESCVLAIERSLVPHPGVLTPEKAFRIALEKVCTSITSGWFREYAWENYDKVLNIANSRFDTNLDYYKLFQEGVKNGTVKPFNKE